ncbi:MAG: DUF2294 domain-containing protein, partial [Halanaerobiales bacterium]
RALTKWEKDYLGRGPVQVKADIIRDMIVVVLQGILTPAEYSLSETKDGLLSIKKIRADLVESGRNDIDQLIKEITGYDVATFHTDISTRTGERVMIFKFSCDIEKKLFS